MGRPTPLTVALLLLGACGREQTERAAAAQDAEFRGTMEAVHRPRAPTLPPRTETLRALAATAHAGYDRVIFEFAGDSLPGYHVEYVSKPIVRCGSGDPVPFAATARLVLRFEPARAHDELGNSTVPERERILSLPALKEMKLVCDFEGQVEWVLGLAAASPYRVMESTEPEGPARLVLDVRHRP